MIKDNLVIFADENLYEKFLLIGADLSELEEISERIGPVLMIDSVYNKMMAKLPRIIGSQSEMAWSRLFQIENRRYTESCAKFSNGAKDQMEAELSVYTAQIARCLNLLDKGATSPVDLAIFANALWFGNHSSQVSCVITDDSDLLRFGHLISSYCGLPTTMFSVFEILMLAGLDSTLAMYCAKYDLPFPDPIENAELMKTQKLKDDLSKLTRKTMLAFHPTLRKNDSIDLICKKR